MCCVDFIIKYVLFAANLVFTLAGVALIGVGIAVLVQLNEVTDLIPVDINGIPIAVIVLGSIVFAIAFFGCCGSIKESRCLLGMYAACMAILAAGKIYLVVVIFKGLDAIQDTVTEWLESAFKNEDLRTGFHAMESLFSCCGTYGPGSYTGVLPALPPTCCGYPLDQQQQCLAADAFGGCTTKLSGWFESFGGAIGYSFIVVICIELIAMIFALVLCWFITDKRSRQRYY